MIFRAPISITAFCNAELRQPRRRFGFDLLKKSYLSLERDSAPGIDGVTWQTYGENRPARSALGASSSDPLIAIGGSTSAGAAVGGGCREPVAAGATRFRDYFAEQDSELRSQGASCSL
jgi:hypothetical protein